MTPSTAYSRRRCSPRPGSRRSRPSRAARMSGAPAARGCARTRRANSPGRRRESRRGCRTARPASPRTGTPARAATASRHADAQARAGTSGTGRPATRSRARAAVACPAGVAAAGRMCHGSPSASATARREHAGRSPTASTPSTGRSAGAATIAATDASSSWNRTGIARSCHGIVERVAAIGRERPARSRGASAASLNARS